MKNLYELEILGKSDAENQNLDCGWFISGIIFGFLAIPFIWILEIQAGGANYSNLNTNTERQVYFSGYRPIVRKKRLGAVIFGWVV